MTLTFCYLYTQILNTAMNFPQNILNVLKEFIKQEAMDQLGIMPVVTILIEIHILLI